MKIILIVPLFFCAFIASSQTRYLIPYRQGNLWGYADTNLNVVVTPKYDEAWMFWLGYATVKKGKLFGMLDSKGKELIAPQYTYFHTETNYLTVAKGKDTGLIQLPTLKVLLPVANGEIVNIHSNFFVVNRRHTGKGLFSSTVGKWLLPGEYSDISWAGISDKTSYYTARKKDYTLYFSISNNGVFSINKRIAPNPGAKEKKPDLPPQEEVVEEIIEEELMAGDSYWLETFSEQGKWGIKSVRNGEETIDSIPPTFDRLNVVSGNAGLIIVRKNDKEGVITMQDEELMPLVYDEVRAVDSTPTHGIFVVKNNGKYGLARDKDLLVSCDYDTIQETNYIKGFALISNNKQGAFIYDRSKALYNILIDARYDYILDIHGVVDLFFNRSVDYSQSYKSAIYLLYVSKNNKRGYVDLQGREYFKD